MLTVPARRRSGRVVVDQVDHEDERLVRPDGRRAADLAVALVRRDHQQAAAAGGTRYPHGACPFTQADWQAHYGSMWPRLVTWKNRYDPKGILTPGPGIF